MSTSATPAAAAAVTNPLRSECPEKRARVDASTGTRTLDRPQQPRGPELTPDERTLFCAVQHPSEGSTLESPSSNWPDRTSPPRPSLVTIVKADPRGGGRFGT